MENLTEILKLMIKNKNGKDMNGQGLISFLKEVNIAFLKILSQKM
jgi:hypothetical protein